VEHPPPPFRNVFTFPVQPNTPYTFAAVARDSVPLVLYKRPVPSPAIDTPLISLAERIPVPVVPRLDPFPIYIEVSVLIPPVMELQEVDPPPPPPPPRAAIFEVVVR
jgi:hypothetical protein